MSKFSDLKNRILISSVIIIFMITLVLFANNKIVQLLNNICIIGISSFALYEYVKLLKIKKIEQHVWFLITISIVIFIFNYLAIIGLNLSIMFVMAVIASFFAVYIYKLSKIEGAIVSISTCILGVIYIVVPLALSMIILYPKIISSNLTDGRMWFAYWIVVTKMTDIGGYFIGRWKGRSKLAPQISPGKTLIGSFAGFACSVLVSVSFYLISINYNFASFHISFVGSVFLGMFVGLFGQIGDLIESLLKRDAHVKDSNTIPGLGGVLDMVDSLLFTAPVVFLFLKTL